MSREIRGRSAGSAGLIGFLDQLDDLLLRIGLPEESPKGVLLEIAENIFHGLQVTVRIVRWGKEKEDGVDGGLIEGGEIERGRPSSRT